VLRPEVTSILAATDCTRIAARCCTNHNTFTQDYLEINPYE